LPSYFILHPPTVSAFKIYFIIVSLTPRYPTSHPVFRFTDLGRYYNRPNLFAGEHELHVGNITCGGHRRQAWVYRQACENIGITVATLFLALLILIIRALSAQNNITCLWHCRFYQQRLFINLPVCLATRAYKRPPTVVSPNPAWASFRTYAKPYNTCPQFNVITESCRERVCVYSSSERQYGH
jgi:hypothetical protein